MCLAKSVHNSANKIQKVFWAVFLLRKLVRKACQGYSNTPSVNPITRMAHGYLHVVLHQTIWVTLVPK